jgi:hypothetical protein
MKDIVPAGQYILSKTAKNSNRWRKYLLPWVLLEKPRFKNRGHGKVF